MRNFLAGKWRVGESDPNPGTVLPHNVSHNIHTSRDGKTREGAKGGRAKKGGGEGRRMEGERGERKKKEGRTDAEREIVSREKGGGESERARVERCQQQLAEPRHEVKFCPPTNICFGHLLCAESVKVRSELRGILVAVRRRREKAVSYLLQLLPHRVSHSNAPLARSLHVCKLIHGY